jgi:hypothetical protein
MRNLAFHPVAKDASQNTADQWREYNTQVD